MKTLLKCCLIFSCVTFVESSSLSAEEGEKSASSFHALVASGYAWSMKADIHVNTTDWAQSLTGYNATLGGSPFITLGFGYSFIQRLDVDFQYTLYDTFSYYKNQIDPYGNSRIRQFELDHFSSMWNATYFPYAIKTKKVSFIPFVGGGIGIGSSKVEDFRTTFYDPAQGIGLTTSLGPSHMRNAFAWQAMAGIRVHPVCSRLCLDVAYRYYNGGTFEGPSSVVDYDGVDLGDVEKVSPWKGTFQTNQLYFAINFSI